MWQTGGGGVGIASFGPFGTQTGQQPDAGKPVCSWVEQVAAGHAWMSQLGVTGTSAPWHQGTSSGETTGLPAEGRRTHPTLSPPAAEGTPASDAKGGKAVHSRSQ